MNNQTFTLNKDDSAQAELLQECEAGTLKMLNDSDPEWDYAATDYGLRALFKLSTGKIVSVLPDETPEHIRLHCAKFVVVK